MDAGRRFGSLVVVAVLIAMTGFGQRLDLSKTVTVKNAYPYHLQGVEADEKGIFWSFSDRIVKTDWAGKTLAELKLFLHCGDLSLRNGRLYVSVCRDVEKTKNTGFLYILNGETLKLEQVKEIPQAPRPDGIAWLGDELFVADDVYGEPWHRGNVICVFDRNLTFIRRFKVDVGEDTHFGVQTLENWGTRMVAGFYSRKTSGSFVLDREGTCLQNLPFYGAEGVAKVPEKLAGKDHVFIVCTSMPPRENWGARAQFFQIDDETARKLSR